jgi:hypothetical protein
LSSNDFQLAIFSEEMFLIFVLCRFEAEVVLRQGQVLPECDLIFAGHLKVLSNYTSMNENSNSDILSEFEEGDFIGVNIVSIFQSYFIMFL